MKKLLINCLIIAFTVYAFITLGIRNKTDSFWEYYLVKNLDLFISLLVLLASCILQLLDYERKRLSGQWSIKLIPQKWKDRSSTYIGEGQMLLVNKEKRKYKGLLILDWKDDLGNLVINGAYEVVFSLGYFRKVTGTSIMKIREEKNSKLIDVDKARVTLCDYNLSLSDNGNKLTGDIIMRETGTKSYFWAEKEF